MVEEGGHSVSSFHLIWNLWWVELTFPQMISMEDQDLRPYLGGSFGSWTFFLSSFLQRGCSLTNYEHIRSSQVYSCIELWFKVVLKVNCFCLVYYFSIISERLRMLGSVRGIRLWRVEPLLLSSCQKHCQQVQVQRNCQMSFHKMLCICVENKYDYCKLHSSPFLSDLEGRNAQIWTSDWATVRNEFGVSDSF